MTQRIEWSPTSEWDLRRLDHDGRERIRQAVYRLVATGHRDVKRHLGRNREWRLRVGDWRVLYTFMDDAGADTLLVLRVLPRGRAYRG